MKQDANTSLIISPSSSIPSKSKIFSYLRTRPFLYCIEGDKGKKCPRQRPFAAGAHEAANFTFVKVPRLES
jgi:hypothetical protein